MCCRHVRLRRLVSARYLRPWHVSNQVQTLLLQQHTFQTKCRSIQPTSSHIILRSSLKTIDPGEHGYMRLIGCRNAYVQMVKLSEVPYIHPSLPSSLCSQLLILFTTAFCPYSHFCNCISRDKELQAQYSFLFAADKWRGRSIYIACLVACLFNCNCFFVYITININIKVAHFSNFLRNLYSTIPDRQTNKQTTTTAKMKSTLPTTLMLLLATGLSSSLPIPSSSTASFPPDCAYHTCHSSLLRLLSSSEKTSTPATTVSEIHVLPPHYKESSSSNIEQFDNSPYTPSANTPVSVALSAKRPLSSDYLQSLGKHTIHIEGQKVEELELGSPTNPKTPLHELPEQDLAHFWATERASRTTATSHGAAPKHRPCREGIVYLPGNIYIKSTHYISRRPDIAVVGIVLLFLVLVVGVEAAGSIARWWVSHSRNLNFGSSDI